MKINLTFTFTLPCGASKGFTTAIKVFLKPFEAPQSGVKIQFDLIFSLRPGTGWEGLNRILVGNGLKHEKKKYLN